MKSVHICTVIFSVFHVRTVHGQQNGLWEIHMKEHTRESLFVSQLFFLLSVKAAHVLQQHRALNG